MFVGVRYIFVCACMIVVSVYTICVLFCMCFVRFSEVGVGCVYIYFILLYNNLLLYDAATININIYYYPIITNK